MYYCALKKCLTSFVFFFILLLKGASNMKALIHSINTVFQDPLSNVDFHWYNGSSYKHLHSDYYELIVIIDGEFSHTYLDEKHILTRGDVVLIKPNYYHLQTSSQQKSLLANFSISLDAFRSITKKLNETAYNNLLNNSGKPVKLTSEELDFIVNSLNKHHHATSFNKESIDFFHLSILHLLLSLMDLQYSKLDIKKEKHFPEWLNIFLDKLESPEVFCLPISEIYSLSVYSQSRFTHLFTQYVGIPPVQYITKLKIDYAKNLLVKTNFSILDIAADLNYGSLSHFITMFKKHTGLTPTEYRKKFYINVD